MCFTIFQYNKLSTCSTTQEDSDDYDIDVHGRMCWKLNANQSTVYNAFNSCFSLVCVWQLVSFPFGQCYLPLTKAAKQKI